MTPDELFTREEVLGGLPARKARALLFLIESRTASLASHARRAMDVYLSERTAEEQDLRFLEDLAQGREARVRPTIQDLERYASQWADLVPSGNPRVRAALAHFLSDKYRFTHPAVPGIRAALGLDDETVQQAHQRLYGVPLATIYAPRPTVVGRLRWAWAAVSRWLEALPPFWTVFALTLTETVGGGIMALPIALAGLGPLAGVVLLVVLGLVNVLTVAYMAEAVSRSGTIRYGSAFIGRAVADYLGTAGSIVLTLGIAGINFLALWAYYVGFATTLSDATGVRAELWVLALFLIGLYFLRRESLSATVAAALVVGFVNIVLVLLLVVLALPYVQPTHLLYVNVPFFNGRPFDGSILQLVFGTVLMAYFGHLSISNCAQVVSRRDPSGRSLFWGSTAAQLVVIVLYSIWVLVVNGAIAPQALAGQSGTALVPLAATAGPVVRVLGSIFVVLAMGMASIHMSLGLFNLVRERLPARSGPVVVLPRRGGRLIARGKLRGRPGGDLRLGLVYLGLEKGDQPRFRLDVQWAGTSHHLEATAAGQWDAATLLDQIAELKGRGIRLTVEVEAATPEIARVRVTSPMALSYEGDRDTLGLDVADLLALPDAERQLLTWVTRRGDVSLADIAVHTGQDERATREMLASLLEQGYLREVEAAGAPRYRARLAPRRARQLPSGIWKALGEEVETSAPTTLRPAGIRGIAQRARDALLGRRARFVLGVSPVAATFLLIEWLLFANAASFTEPVNIMGAIVAPLLAGVFPVLLLLSSRQKGERVPAVVYRFLGHPLLTVSICLLYLTSLFAYGLIIWSDPVQRGLALAVGLLMVGLTIAVWRRGAFAPRLTVELREEQDRAGEAVFSVTAAGRLVEADVRLGYPGGDRQIRAATGEAPAFSRLRYAIFDLPPRLAQELKVWVHRVTVAGDSEGLPARLAVRGDGTSVDLEIVGGQALLPLPGDACHVEIRPGSASGEGGPA